SEKRGSLYAFPRSSLRTKIHPPFLEFQLELPCPQLANDIRTRARLIAITNWSFFRSTNEQSLLDRGLTVGVTCLLCGGVPHLEEYVSGLNNLTI
ncbi:hypothetical protein VP01_707g1, partial [Puccinia sorghi]